MKTSAMPYISEVQITPVKPNDGLLGFASFIYDGTFYFSSIAIHTRPAGGIRLVYPRIRGVDVFHPINSETGRFIEAAIERKYLEMYC